jgi:hypothetical protein
MMLKKKYQKWLKSRIANGDSTKAPEPPVKEVSPPKKRTKPAALTPDEKEERYDELVNRLKLMKVDIL